MNTALSRLFSIREGIDSLRPAGRTDRWLVAESLRRAVPTRPPSEDDINRVLDLMTRLYAEIDEDLSAAVLPGVHALLSELKRRRYLLGLLTGNVEPIALTKMRRSRLNGFFQLGGYGYHSENRSEVVRAALEQVQMVTGQSEGHEITVVGDTPLDVEAARVHGLRTLAVATGTFPLDQIRVSSPDRAVPDLSDRDAIVGWLESFPSSDGAG